MGENESSMWENGCVIQNDSRKKFSGLISIHLKRRYIKNKETKHLSQRAKEKMTKIRQKSISIELLKIKNKLIKKIELFKRTKNGFTKRAINQTILGASNQEK